MHEGARVELGVPGPEVWCRTRDRDGFGSPTYNFEYFGAGRSIASDIHLKRDS
jgi:hypothetical protein